MRIWIASKPRGSIDRKRININNMNPFAIVDPRKLSPNPNLHNLSGLGIVEKLDQGHVREAFAKAAKSPSRVD